jgi:predicted cupin superfamily sugar epimerase
MAQKTLTASDFIERFNMMKHPEGGYFLETYRANKRVSCKQLDSNFNNLEGSRDYSTAIYFLLDSGDVSHLHRIKSDEVWHFYAGGPLKIFEVSEEGELKETILGPNFLNGEKFQYVVPANTWFGAVPLEGTSFSFVGCTVAPGFDFLDFELAKKESFFEQYPKIKEKVRPLLL